MKEVYVAKDPREKELQRALMQYRIPANAAKVREALRRAGRTDLIGTGPKCLVAPESRNDMNRSKDTRTSKNSSRGRTQGRENKNGKGNTQKRKK